MTQEEAKVALFKLHQEYMNHTPKERLELYDEYQKKRGLIREELIKSISSQKKLQIKIVQ